MTASSRILGETRANRKLWREVNLTGNAQTVEVVVHAGPKSFTEVAFLAVFAAAAAEVGSSLTS
jgi:hypothetical protein